MAQATKLNWQDQIKHNVKVAAVSNSAMQYLKLANEHDLNNETANGIAALAVYDALIAYQVVLNKSFGK